MCGDCSVSAFLRYSFEACKMLTRLHCSCVQDAQTDPGEVLLAALQGRLCRPASADHTHGRSNRPVAIPPSAARSQDSAPQPQPQPLPTTHPRAGRAAHVGPPAAQLRPDISARLSPAMAARLGIHGASAAQPACPRAAPPAYPRAATAARQTAATTSARGRSQADDGRNTATKISERRASRQAVCDHHFYCACSFSAQGRNPDVKDHDICNAHATSTSRVCPC